LAFYLLPLIIPQGRTLRQPPNGSEWKGKWKGKKVNCRNRRIRILFA